MKVFNNNEITSRWPFACNRHERRLLRNVLDSGIEVCKYALICQVDSVALRRPQQ